VSRINIAGTQAFMQSFAPKLASLLQGDWLVIDSQTKVKIPDPVGIEVTATNGKTTVKFDTPLPIQVQRGWGPFNANFSGTIQAVLEIDGQGAQVQLSGMPLGNNNQTLQWVP
jgi:hypothetical protein